jgi:DNA-binding FadR family transcriptional regulator
MPSANEPIQRRKLSSEVRDRLLAWLASGELQPGDRLPSERELMARFSVGRPAIREALQSLESAGLIEISHGERARVAEVDARAVISQIGDTARQLLKTDAAALQELREARLMFEAGMVRSAARRAKPEDVARLGAILATQREAVGNVSDFVRADMAFHKAIAEISGNRICVAVSEAMLDWLFEFRREMLRVPGAEKITLSEHKRILDRIRAHDEEGAVKAMTDHLTRSNKRYRALNA